MYKVGDKVRVKKFEKRPYGWNSEGKMDHLMGKVVKVLDIADDLLFIEDKYNNDFWAVKFTDVEPVKTNECIVIYRKDREVIALDKSTGGKGVARCNPADEFDFYTGAKLAFERLTGEEKKKLLNTRICVTEDFTRGCTRKFTKGKIYEIKDGKITDDEGKVFPRPFAFENIEQVKDYFSSKEDWKGIATVCFDFRPVKFVEVKE